MNVQWVMLEGVNDKEEHARQVLDLVTAHGGIECKFNLIVFNPHEGTNFRASSREATLAFRFAARLDLPASVLSVCPGA